MTATERQGIISDVVQSVLQSLRTNSARIVDLTRVTSLPANSYIELSDGKRIKADDLANAIQTRILNEAVYPIISTLTPGEGGEYVFDGVTSGTFNSDNNSIELKNAAGEVISTIDLSSIGSVGKGIDKSDELFSEFENPYIVKGLLTATSVNYKGKKYFQIAKAAGDSCVTRPIPVKPGDKIRYTGWVADGCPAVVGFKEIRYVEGNDHLYAYIYEPKVYLGRWTENNISYGNGKRKRRCGLHRVLRLARRA